jgi:hypothetical protein
MLQGTGYWLREQKKQKECESKRPDKIQLGINSSLKALSLQEI